MLESPESGDKPAPRSSTAPIHPCPLPPQPPRAGSDLIGFGGWGRLTLQPSIPWGSRSHGEGAAGRLLLWQGDSLERERVLSTGEALPTQRHLICLVWPSLRVEAGNAQAAQGQGWAGGISESRAGWVVSDSAWAHFPFKRPAWMEARARKPCACPSWARCLKEVGEDGRWSPRREARQEPGEAAGARS